MSEPIDFIAQCTAFITAARNTTDVAARVVYAVYARNALSEAQAKIESLLINVRSVEALLPAPAETPKGAEQP